MKKLVNLFKRRERRYECYFDASYRKGKSHGAFYIVKSGKLVKMSSRKIKECPSSDIAEAEVLHSLFQYISQKIPKGSFIHIYGDAKGVIDGAVGRTSKSRRYASLHSKYKALSERYNINITFIPRKENKLADQLSRGDTKDFDKLFHTSIHSGGTDDIRAFAEGLMHKVLNIFTGTNKNSEMQKCFYMMLIELKNLYSEQFDIKDRCIEAAQEHIAEQDKQIHLLISALISANQPLPQEIRLRNSARRFTH